jgi:RES domain-containing protein
LKRVYRVLRKAYAQTPFDGEGAYRYGGRWSSPGTRVAYASEHESLAVLEYFVHLDAGDPPTDLVLASAEISDELNREIIEKKKLSHNWREAPAPPELATFGDDFIRRAECAGLIVPSAVAPSENNWLLNPAHPDFRKIVIRDSEPPIYDSRLIHRERGRHKKK